VHHLPLIRILDVGSGSRAAMAGTMVLRWRRAPKQTELEDAPTQLMQMHRNSAIKLVFGVPETANIIFIVL